MTLQLKKHLDIREKDIAALIDDVQALRDDMAKILRRTGPRLLDKGLDTARDAAGEISEYVSDRAHALYRDAARTAAKQGAKTYKRRCQPVRHEFLPDPGVSYRIGREFKRLCFVGCEIVPDEIRDPQGGEQARRNAAGEGRSPVQVSEAGPPRGRRSRSCGHCRAGCRGTDRRTDAAPGVTCRPADSPAADRRDGARGSRRRRPRCVWRIVLRRTAVW